MKPLFPLLLVLALSAGAAHAQGNTATLSQEGSDHQATVTQTGGPGNEATVTQVGDHGVVLLGQFGAGNQAELSSIPGAGYGGSHNSILLMQSGGAEATVNQTGSHNTVWGLAPGTQAGSLDGSVLDVTQVGYGNTLWLDQHNGAAATVIQLGIGNTATIIQH
ncbi:MAG TPA: hypothetical protein VK002_05330 [Rubricoccaceae bacterium]|nr:hypothetical protein [Rubricoccaceae bacterium]